MKDGAAGVGVFPIQVITHKEVEMTIHENQMILPGEDAIVELVAKVLDDPRLEPVHELVQLRERHKAEFDTAVRLQAQVKALEADALALDERKAATQRVHDALADKARANEDKVFNRLMNAQGIEEVRATHGLRTGEVVRDYALEWLMDTDYKVWLEELGELQKELDAFPGAIKEAVKVAKKRGDEAQAQFTKAGDLLLQISEMEKALNG